MKISQNDYELVTAANLKKTRVISGVLHHKPPTDAILLSLSYFMFSLYVNIHSISALAESSLRAHNYIAHFLFLG